MPVEYDDSELQEFINRNFPDALDRATRYTATDLWGNIRREAPVDTGRLAGSYQMQQRGVAFYEIVSGVEYAWWVHEGTGLYGPHNQRIQPVQAQALKFFWRKLGETVIFKGDLATSQERARFAVWAEARGMRPFFIWPAGQPANPYIDRSIDQTEMRINEFVQRAIREVVD